MMPKKTARFNSAKVDYYFTGGFALLDRITERSNTVLITDENVFAAHGKKFRNRNCIVLKAGEASKAQRTADGLIEELLAMGAGRTTTLVGVGGGVITDIVGYVASVYLRGVPFGFVPTSLIGMSDASIGGKNGVNLGVYKNMVGTIRQPGFILFDISFLDSLPGQEWRNGFAEIIKHAAIRDRAMFLELEKNSLSFYRKHREQAAMLVQRNALLKTRIVQRDELEAGERRVLNFGHTLGHALENQYELSHGEAISIGMAYAATLSAALTGFREDERLIALLAKYKLPVFAGFDRKKVTGVMRKDKKSEQDLIHFVLLERIGKASVHMLSLQQIFQTLR